MKRIVLLLFFCHVAAVSLYADTYKVLYVNSKSIIINGKVAKKGLIFNDSDEIRWTSEKQAIRVINLANNKVYLIPAKKYIKNNSKSLLGYLESMFHRVNHLSSYGIYSYSLHDEPLVLLDSILIKIDETRKDEVNYSVVTQRNGFSIATPIKSTKDGCYVILNRKVFDNYDVGITYFDMLQTDIKTGRSKYVYRNLPVELIPLKAD